MTDTPWYMVPGATDATTADKGSPERNRKHIESIAESASAEADAVVSRLRASEAQGIAIPPSVRMAMGYTVNARKAAAQLGETLQHQESVSTDDLTPDQRLARGYGSTN
ncbi:hypothetical protein ACOZE3_24145 [Streptomyces cinereoruber]|uniref:hypothetical protein n=1 Tax=Streptomyces cinereoruber TaxID=67260 RepID=UPI003BF4AE05